MKAKLIKAISIVVVALSGMAATIAFAQTATTSFQVQAQVNTNCVVSATNLTFSTPYDGASGTPNDSGASTIDVRCTKDAPFAVALNVGSVTGAIFANRRMFNGTDYMNYNLYRDSARTEVWGDGTSSTFTVAGTGAGLGAPQAIILDVYGRIPINQTLLSPGAYTEPTITVTVSY